MGQPHSQTQGGLRAPLLAGVRLHSAHRPSQAGHPRTGGRSLPRHDSDHDGESGLAAQHDQQPARREQVRQGAQSLLHLPEEQLPREVLRRGDQPELPDRTLDGDVLHRLQGQQLLPQRVGQLRGRHEDPDLLPVPTAGQGLGVPGHRQEGGTRIRGLQRQVLRDRNRRHHSAGSQAGCAGQAVERQPKQASATDREGSEDLDC